MRHLENAHATRTERLRLSSGKTIVYTASVSGHVYGERGQGYCDVTAVTVEDLYAHDDDGDELPIEPDDRAIIEDHADGLAPGWLAK